MHPEGKALMNGVIQTRSYLRHRLGEDRRTEPGRYSELTYDAPLVGAHCSQCGHVLKAGQRPALFAVGPDGPDSAEIADHGGWYNALAVPIHESCAWPQQAAEIP